MLTILEVGHVCWLIVAKRLREAEVHVLDLAQRILGSHLGHHIRRGLHWDLLKEFLMPVALTMTGSNELQGAQVLFRRVTLGLFL